MEVVSVDSTVITHISSVRLHVPKDLRSNDSKKTVLKGINAVKKRFPEGPPLLKPVDDMKIEDDAFANIVKNIEEFEKK